MANHGSDTKYFSNGEIERRKSFYNQKKREGSITPEVMLYLAEGFVNSKSEQNIIKGINILTDLSEETHNRQLDIKYNSLIRFGEARLKELQSSKFKVHGMNGEEPYYVPGEGWGDGSSRQENESELGGSGFVKGAGIAVGIGAAVLGGLALFGAFNRRGNNQ